ncbi:hypothetical protein [Candidatus Poriferisodalis sp.]|uniref:hypothetical protein n=1 Tax=Candidatus Poriferisodalis sp. TaxID=3101277 RepID=UPI003B029314
MAALRRGDDEFRLRLLLHDFAMVWQHTAAQVHPTLVAVGPLPIDVRWNALVAAFAEHLSLEAETDPPAWTQHPSRFLSDCWFAGGCFGFDRARTVAATPSAFGRHGVWLPQDELTVT